MGNRKKGFSLLELLIYMALLSIVVVVEIFLGVTSGRSRNEVQSFVDGNLRFAVQKIESDLRAATSITTPASGGGGPLGAWANTTALPPLGMQYHSAVAYNGYLYTTGGRIIAGGEYNFAVYYFNINSTGSLGVGKSTTALPALDYHSAVVNNGYIYTTGGRFRRSVVLPPASSTAISTRRVRSATGQARPHYRALSPITPPWLTTVTSIRRGGGTVA